MNNKMEKDKEIIDEYHNTQNEYISPYITKLKDLTGWTGNIPNIELNLIPPDTQSEMSKEEFTAIKEILNQLIID